mmetsp:Transcript_3997/g.12572  ORF Transcript_3997/g.12572 Transcript_3997/m.12572 type:complete len:304 (+) Transcript_3997:143-1054(+)
MEKLEAVEAESGQDACLVVPSRPPEDGTEVSQSGEGSNQDDEGDARLLYAAFAELAKEASEIESIAMELDRAGDAEQAVACYRQAVQRLSAAAAACPEGNPDRVVLSGHAGQVLGRVVYLESLAGAPAAAPVEQHIGSAQLGTGTDGAPLPEPVGWGKRAASAAAVGGAAGLLVLHAPVTAVALAAGAAYATTREDGAGKAARTVGDIGLQAASRAQTLAQENRLPERAERAWGRVLAVEERYGVVGRAQATATSSWLRLQELEREYGVAGKLGQGLVSASASAASATTTATAWAARVLASRR